MTVTGLIGSEGMKNLRELFFTNVVAEESKQKKKANVS